MVAPSEIEYVHLISKLVSLASAYSESRGTSQKFGMHVVRLCMQALGAECVIMLCSVTAAQMIVDGTLIT